MTDKKTKTSRKVEELVEEISKLSVLDLSELVKALQEKLGVSPQTVAAAPVSGQAAIPTVEGAAQSASGGTQTVIMTAAGANKIAVIKALREINQNLTLMDAKKMTETPPAEILKDAKAEDVKMASEKLKAAGATVELK
jgi:large subunit ribosomal protein L7/L12